MATLILLILITAILGILMLILINLDYDEEAIAAVIVSFIISSFATIIIGLDVLNGNTTPDEPHVTKEMTNLNADSIYQSGYRRGQIDCQNDSIVWRKVMNDDGEIIFQKTK